MKDFKYFDNLRGAYHFLKIEYNKYNFTIFQEC